MLYNHPENIFVAGFIGSPQMNFIDSVIIKENQNYFVKFDKYRIKLPNRMSDNLKDYENKEVILGIRPENISIAKNDDNENVIELYVDIAEMTGADCYMYGTLNNKKIIANVSSNQNIESDKSYKLKLDIDRIHIFDKINERLICDWHFF